MRILKRWWVVIPASLLLVYIALDFLGEAANETVRATNDLEEAVDLRGCRTDWVRLDPGETVSFYPPTPCTVFSRDYPSYLGCIRFDDAAFDSQDPVFLSSRVHLSQHDCLESGKYGRHEWWGRALHWLGEKAP